MTLKRFPLRGPFQGVVSDVPSPEGQPTDFDDVVNFLVRKGVVHTRPRLNLFSQDTTTPRSFGTFKDLFGNFHTYKLVEYLSGQTPGYALDTLGAWNPLAFPALTAGQLGSTLPFAEAFTQNQVYFANGGYPLWYMDGSATIKVAGNVPGSCRFLAVNVSHLIEGYCIEPAPGTTGSLILPRRVRWSGSNNPQSWDPATDFTSGFNDLLDVPDEITGLSTNSRNSYVWRTNGITVMFPTGVGLAAFDFENFSIAPEGVGNAFPYALSTYDNRTAFISNYDLHLFDSSSFSDIGGMNTKRIFRDLADNTGDVVWGKLIPGFPGIDFLSYWLSIPGPDVTWVYSLKDNLWVRFASSVGLLTALRTVVTS